jgi:amino acid adenylation domain-containing protein
MHDKPPSADRRSYAPTATQEGMIFQALFDSDEDLNHEQLVVGGVSLEEEAWWNQAWQRAYEKLSALRSYFQWEGVEEPRLHIAEPTAIPWEKLSGSRAELEEFLRVDRQRIWDLRQAPLLRVTWFELPDEGTATVVWSFHHILIDGRSIIGVLSGVQAFVNAYREGRPEPQLPIADFDALMRALEARDSSKDKAFWQKYLSGFRAVNELPGMLRTRDDTAPTRPYELMRVGPSLRRMKKAAAARGLTLGTIIQCAWCFILAKSSGESDIVIGVARAGRNFHPHAMFGVGMFMTTVPMRSLVDLEMDVLEWLRVFRDGTLGAREHEHCSLAEIQALTPIPSGTDLFTSLVAIENDYLNESKLNLDEHWRSRTVELHENAGYPLVLTTHANHDGNLVMTLGADLRFIEKSTVEPTLERFARVMDVLVEVIENDTKLKLADLEWLPEAERAALKGLYPPPAPAPDKAFTVDGLFQQQVARVPDEVAVVGPKGRLTYRELDDLSNQVAQLLKKHEVKQGDFVAVCLDRDPLMIAALLGVLKVGAAYVPIDRFLPRERIERIYELGAPRTTITLKRLLTALPDDLGEILTLDRVSELPRAQVERAHDASAACYAVFTSGTTGQPKGIVTSHSNLVSIFQSWRDAYRLFEHKSHLQMASYTFDVFSGDFARALLSGGKLVLAEPERLLNPEELGNLIRAEAVDIAEFVPLVLRTLVDHLELSQTELPSLRTVIAGSDVWYVSEYRRFQKIFGEKVRLINSYGLSECTIDSTFFEGPLPEAGDDKVLPIGRPFDNTVVRVVEESGRDAGINRVGELLIGGHGVTGGYLGNPESPRFFRGADGLIWYKTGDLARLQADGLISLVGRADTQVKIQGYRVELGEVEAALMRHPSVSDCVVVTHERSRGDRYLVAYVVSAGESLNIEELRAATKEHLPHYMNPRAFMQLKEIPHTPNGKVDKKALPEPNDARAEILHVEYQPPVTPTQVRIAKIWSDLLGVPRVGLRDNFFELGGHSLLAVRLFARVNEFADPKLPLPALVSAQTVEQMAYLVDNKSQGEQGLIQLTSGPEDRPALFWIHTLGGGGGGGFFRYQYLSQRFRQPRRSYGIQAPAVPFRRIDEMATFYADLIKKAQPHGPYHVLGYCFGGTVAYEVARQLKEGGEEVGVVGLIDAEARMAVPPPSSFSEVLEFVANACTWLWRFLRQDIRHSFAWVRRRLFPMLGGAVRGDLSAFEYRLEDFMEAHEQDPAYRPFVEAHWAAASRYEPRRFGGEVLLVRSRYQSITQYQRAMGWRNLANRVDVRILDYTHGELLNDPARDIVAEMIEKKVLESESGPRSS